MRQGELDAYLASVCCRRLVQAESDWDMMIVSFETDFLKVTCNIRGIFGGVIIGHEEFI